MSMTVWGGFTAVPFSGWVDVFFFSSRRRHTRYWRDWSSDVCSSDLPPRSTTLRFPNRSRPSRAPLDPQVGGGGVEERGMGTWPERGGVTGVRVRVALTLDRKSVV